METQRNPSKLLLKPSESQVFGFFWGASVTCWLLYSLLCSSKTPQSTKALTFFSLAEITRFYCSKFCKSTQNQPIRKAALLPAWCTRKVLTFSIKEKVTFSLATGVMALGRMCHRLERWDGVAIRDLVTCTPPAPWKILWWGTGCSNVPFFCDWWPCQDTPWKAQRIYS